MRRRPLISPSKNWGAVQLRGGVFYVLRNAPGGKPGIACVLFSDAGVPERRDVRGALLDGALYLLIVAGAVLASSMGHLAR